MKNKQEIVDNWLPRYTGVPLDGFGEHILLTNFGGYVHTFARLTGAEVLGLDRPMPSATADGITMINFGMGSPNAATMMDLLSAIGPKADVVVTCHEGGLSWTVSAGDGGNQWEQKEPLTFYWRSTLPPAGPADVYALDTDGTRSTGRGPYPKANVTATNACET